MFVKVDLAYFGGGFAVIFLTEMILTDCLNVCSRHSPLKRRNLSSIYPNTGRVVPQDCFSAGTE